MFDIGWSEMAVIAVVALIVIGPKELPHLLYKAGKMAAKARSVLRELQQGIEEMGREAELEELRKKMQAVGNIDVEREIEKTVDPEGDLRRALGPPIPDEAAADREVSVPAPPAQPAEPARSAAEQSDAVPSASGEKPNPDVLRPERDRAAS